MATGTAYGAREDSSGRAFGSMWYNFPTSKHSYPPERTVQEDKLRFETPLDWAKTPGLYMALQDKFELAVYSRGAAATQDRFLSAQEPEGLQQFSKKVLFPVGIHQWDLEGRAIERPVELQKGSASQVYLLRFTEEEQKALEACLSVFNRALNFSDYRVQRECEKCIQKLRNAATKESEAEKIERNKITYRKINPVDCMDLSKILEAAATIFEEFSQLSHIFASERETGNLVGRLSRMLDPSKNDIMGAYCAHSINEQYQIEGITRDTRLEGPFVPKTEEGKKAIRVALKALRFNEDSLPEAIDVYKTARPTTV